MFDMRDLYQDVILDHGKNPRNFHIMPGCSCSAKGHNPLCGDKLTVYLKVSGDILEDISFEGSGCAISTASASMLTETLKGKTKTEAAAIFDQFHNMLTGVEGPTDLLDKLEVFQGVKEFPMRVKCATLAWHTFNAALSNDGEKPVSTE